MSRALLDAITQIELALTGMGPGVVSTAVVPVGKVWLVLPGALHQGSVGLGLAGSVTTTVDVAIALGGTRRIATIVQSLPVGTGIPPSTMALASATDTVKTIMVEGDKIDMTLATGGAPGPFNASFTCLAWELSVNDANTILGLGVF